MAHPASRPDSPWSFSTCVRLPLIAVLLAGSIVLATTDASARVFVRGQVVPDRSVDITDAIALLNFLFLGASEPICLSSADANDDGALDITDPVRILLSLFSPNAPLPAPFPAPGLDPTPDDLTCAAFPLDDVRVSPTSLTLTTLGATAQLQVTGEFRGEEVDLTSTSTGTTYEVSPSTIAQVSSNGLVTALEDGNATISVRYDAFSASVRLQVEAAPVPTGDYQVLVINDLGMHCIDRETSVYSILPPFNVVTAQVVLRQDSGSPVIVGPELVDVRYSAVADQSGSINTTSVGKTDFWNYVDQAYGVQLPPGQGLLGHTMPADTDVEAPLLFEFDAASKNFVAAGIPITDRDDEGARNYYPMMRVSAVSRASGELLASTDVVLPISSETDCQNCHVTGGVAANDPDIAWSEAEDPEVQAKTNVLLLHDSRELTQLASETPVLCARCHYSLALDLAGTGPTGEQIGKLEFSWAMHDFHGRVRGPNDELLFQPDGNAHDTCYQCHPGRITECYRGAMKTGGLECRNCHGDMLSVGGAFPLEPGGSTDGEADGETRRPWLDLPRCQSCHTGDALSHRSGPGFVASPDGIRLRQTFVEGDPSASPILATNKRFAENDGKLYRFSTGHGGVACEHCHGSTHAEWPVEDPGANDNVTARQIQGHSGTIIECSACHAPGTLPTTVNGPHGIHNVDDLRWIDHRHEDQFERNPDSCRACHGSDLRGTVLSRAAADRAYDLEDGIHPRFPKGMQIGCMHCHGDPREDDD